MKLTGIHLPGFKLDRKGRLVRDVKRLDVSARLRQEVFRRLAEQRESKILEGHLMLDHVHMLILIPPKYAVSQVVGFIKGKSAIHLARVYGKGTATLWDSTSEPEGISSTPVG